VVTLSDIELMAYRRLGYADTPATEVVTRMRQWINLWHVRLVSRPGVETLRDVPLTFTTVALQPQYTLPATVRRVMKIFDSLTPLALRSESLTWIRETDPGLMSIGTSEVWAPVSWVSNALRIQLWPTPGAVVTYNIDAQTTIAPLAAPTDQPLLLDEYGWLLVEAACYEEWMRKADTRAGTARQDMETGFKEMRHWVNNPPDYKPVAGGNPATVSRYGGMFPA